MPLSTPLFIYTRVIHEKSLAFMNLISLIKISGSTEWSNILRIFRVAKSHF